MREKKRSASVSRSKQDLKNATAKMKEVLNKMLELKKLAEKTHLCSIHSCDSDTSSDSLDSPRLPHPVFMNDVILQEIFSFLNLEDFMACRLVCQKWKSVGEAQFKSRVLICFNFKLPQPQFDLRAFFQDAQVEFPFRLVKFKGSLSLSTSNLKSLFANEAKFITHLKLKNINLAEEDLTTNENPPYLSECNIMDIISGIENLKSLEIKRKEGWTRLKLSLVSLRGIKYINLENCSIELSATTIAPIELRLRSVKFFCDGLPAKVVRVNDFVEFEVMEKLVIIHPRSIGSTDLYLDLVGNVTLKHLEFLGVRICNLKQTSWSAKSLDIYCAQFTERSSLKVEEFFLHFSKCDLRCLPHTVNKLSIGAETILIGTDFHNVSLPSIRSLELIDKYAMKVCFPHLATSFTNLRELKLQRATSSFCIIDINQIPNTVESLIFGNSGFRFVGVGVTSLNSLTIEEDYKHNLQFIATVTKHFLPKLLKAEVEMSTPKPINRLIHLESLLNTTIPRIMLGELHKHLLAYLKTCPTFEAKRNTGQIVNSNGSKITFSF